MENYSISSLFDSVLHYDFYSSTEILWFLFWFRDMKDCLKEISVGLHVNMWDHGQELGLHDIYVFMAYTYLIVHSSYYCGLCFLAIFAILL